MEASGMEASWMEVSLELDVLTDVQVAVDVSAHGEVRSN